MLVSYPKKEKPIKKYPIKNMVKFIANAQINIELITIHKIIIKTDLLPNLDDK
jgi:hypothetical protein